MFEAEVTDISPLTTLPIRVLDLGKTNIANFEHLKKIKSLVELNLSDTQFGDISILKLLPQLRVLEVTGCPVNQEDDFKHFVATKKIALLFSNFPPEFEHTLFSSK